MTHKNPGDDELYEILDTARTIAVVGASSDPAKPSHEIFKRLQDWGYRVIPVNPREREVWGEKAYDKLADVPERVDIVNVFRQPAATPGIAAEAVAAGAGTLWLQLGIAHEEAAAIAEAGGLNVVMDNCMGVTLGLLQVPRRGHAG